ncbi:NAD-dependent epimerase/dehydratase family protein, partial [Pseudomonadota bacterium]
YGKSKLKAEGVFNGWAESEPDRNLSIIRFVVIFGEENKGNVHNLITQVANNKFIMIGSGKNKKSMAYVGNVVKFLSQLSMSKGKNIFNYSDKPDMTANNLIELIRLELGMSASPLIRIPYWLGLVGGYFFDLFAMITGRTFPISSIRIKKFCANTVVSSDAVQATKFIAPYSLEEGLRRMIKNIKLANNPS